MVQDPTYSTTMLHPKDRPAPSHYEIKKFRCISSKPAQYILLLLSLAHVLYVVNTSQRGNITLGRIRVPVNKVSRWQTK